MMEMNSKTVCETTETSPVYVNPDQIPDINNVRFRHFKPNIPTQTLSQPAHLILSTGDFPLNEKFNDIHPRSQNKHDKIQISFLIFTALCYLLHTIRAYIPENMQTSYHFWSSIKSLPIPRNYTSNLRPNLLTENLLLRLTELCQTLWLIYLLTYIARRTHLGYLYRNPNIFNPFFCSLLISAVVLQTISQTLLPPEIFSACLLISLILLIITCRLIILKLLKYEEKLKSIDLIIIRYFVLNSLFLYTTSIAYLTICASIECIAFHLDPNFKSLPLGTTIGLSIVFILLLIYLFLDQFIYENEFRSIWTPYLFLAITFHCPPLRRLLLNEIDLITNDLNYYLFWVLFITIILIILIRISRQIYVKYREKKTKSRVRSFLEQKPLEAET